MKLKETPTDQLITLNSVIGALAHSVAVLSPYHTTRGVDTLIQILVKNADDLRGWSNHIGFVSKQFKSYHDLYRWIEGSLTGHPILEQWNTPVNQTSSHQFITRNSVVPDPDDDFIDIDALFQYMCRLAWDEAVREQKASAEFERDWRQVTEDNDLVFARAAKDAEGDHKQKLADYIAKMVTFQTVANKKSQDIFDDVNAALDQPFQSQVDDMVDKIKRLFPDAE